MSDQVIDIAGNAPVVHGFLYGMRHPAISLSVRVRCHGDETAALARIDRELREIFPGIDAARFSGDGARQLLARLLYWTGEMQRHIGLAVYETGKILTADAGRRSDFRILVPTMPRTQGNVTWAVCWLQHLFNRTWEGQSTAELRAELPGIWRILERSVPNAHNTVYFAKCAHRLDIPVSHVAGGTYQFGYGARGRWLNSTFTDRTSQISAVLARNKLLTAKTLTRAGLPVSPHVLVKNEKEALAAAGRLGYPVVVKPGDRDRGEGVAAGLRDAASLQWAFEAARKVSSNILVERHAEGRDYRLTVLDGELAWAIERIPGGVTGDGEHTVRELVARLNRDPRRGPAAHLLLKTLDINEEAKALLAEQSLSLEDVPETGRFVRLRRTGNIGRGGTSVDVWERVHPDNRRLAERAATALRLDIAGVDMLLPDIARSWRETGGVICEVNAQPNIGLVGSVHLYESTLRHLVPGGGRIPIAVLVGGGESSGSVSSVLAETFEKRGLRVGRFERGRLTVAGERIGGDWQSAFAAGEALIADAGVEAIVFSIADPGVLRTGSPFDAFDTLIVAADDAGMREGAVGDLVQALAPACRGGVFVDNDSIHAATVARLVSPERLESVSFRDEAVFAAAIEAGFGDG